jgi:hypothetical protein
MKFRLTLLACILPCLAASAAENLSVVDVKKTHTGAAPTAQNPLLDVQQTRRISGTLMKLGNSYCTAGHPEDGMALIKQANAACKAVCPQCKGKLHVIPVVSQKLQSTTTMNSLKKRGEVKVQASGKGKTCTWYCTSCDTGW